MNIMAIAPWAVLIAAMLGLFLAATSPGFAARLVTEAFKLALPDILAIAKALVKPASPEELKRQKSLSDRGQDPNAAGQSARKSNRQKSW